nr:hypothetical protein [Snodgrassella alvi]
MAIDNRKERIIKKLAKKQGITPQELYFLVSHFKKIDERTLNEDGYSHIITVTVLEIYKGLDYEIIWRRSRFKSIPHEFYSQPTRVEKTQKTMNVFVRRTD